MSVASHYRASTVAAHRSRLRSAERYAGAPLAEVLTDQERTDALVAALRERVSPGHARNIVQAVRDHARYLCERATGQVRRPPTSEDATERAHRVFEAHRRTWSGWSSQRRKRGPRFHLLVLSLVDTGIRVGEALGLEWPMLRLAHTPPLSHCHPPRPSPGWWCCPRGLATRGKPPGVTDRLKDGNRYEKDRSGA